MPNTPTTNPHPTDASTTCATTTQQERDQLIADLEAWLRAEATPDTDTGDPDTDPAADTLDWADR